MSYYLDGPGSFSLKGGDGKANGGAGSGGRLKLLRFNWRDDKYFTPPNGTDYLKDMEKFNETSNFTISN